LFVGFKPLIVLNFSKKSLPIMNKPRTQTYLTSGQNDPFMTILSQTKVTPQQIALF
jgi:hypothetical protein